MHRVLTQAPTSNPAIGFLRLELVDGYPYGKIFDCHMHACGTKVRACQDLCYMSISTIDTQTPAYSQHCQTNGHAYAVLHNIELAADNLLPANMNFHHRNIRTLG